MKNHTNLTWRSKRTSDSGATHGSGWRPPLGCFHAVDSKRPDPPEVLVLTTFDSDDYLFAALQAGASGFLLKNAQAEQLVDALRAVGHGHALLAPEVTQRVIAQMSAGPATQPGGAGRHAGLLGQLTDRERDVLRLMGVGRSNAEIADELVIGAATVKTHVSSIFAKLQVRDRVGAVIIAHESGLVVDGGSAG